MEMTLNIITVYTRTVCLLLCADIDSKSDLNERAQEEARLQNSSFGMEDFTYNNTSILEVLFGYLERTDFKGITVSFS